LIDLEEEETGIEMNASARTNPSSLSSRLGTTKDVLELIPEFSSFVDMVIKGRKFAITKHGYMGLVPQVAYKGDIICILLGCTFPVVLHEVEDYQYFTGDAYIHGIMDGEALQGEWQSTVRTFRLRYRCRRLGGNRLTAFAGLSKRWPF